MTKEKSTCGCHITDGQSSQCPVCVSCVYSLNFWDRVWFLVSVTRSAARSVLREQRAMLAAGPSRPVLWPGLTVNTSAGSHCRGSGLISVHRAARSPEQGAELGEGGGRGSFNLWHVKLSAPRVLCVNHEDDICYRVPKLWTQLPQCNLH